MGSVAIEVYPIPSSGSFITVLAQSRGIAKSDLVSKIMENANAFRVAAGTILGQQQKFLEELRTATPGDYRELLTRIIAW